MKETTAFLVIFLLAFIPRTLALDAYVAPDEGKWIYRSAHFLQAWLNGNLAGMTSVAATPEVEVLAPAVPTMWSGAIGLAAKYWLADRSQAATLAAYLRAIPAATEKIPLDFYPWTRFPTVLLTSLFIPICYGLLSKLGGPGPAFVAAVLLALDPFFLGLSRVIHHDALVSIFIILSLLALLLSQQRRKEATAGAVKPAFWLGLSGAAGGLALLTKPTALYLLVFVALFLLLANGRPRRWSGWRRAGFDGLGWGLPALATFVLLWPALWAAPWATLTALLDRSASAVSENNNYALLPGPGAPLPELGFLFYPVNWLFKSTPPVLAGLIALLAGWRRGWFTPEPAGQPANSPASQFTLHHSPFALRHAHVSWTIKWLSLFSLLFFFLLLPADTRDIRYFLPAMLALHALAAIGLSGCPARAKDPLAETLPASRRTLHVLRFAAHPSPLTSLPRPTLLLLFLQLSLAVMYYPYYVDYLNPLAGGPWLAPRLIKIGSGEGLDQIGRYLDQKPNAKMLRVATSFWESFVPFFSGRYTKPHYDEEADYLIIYLRQIQNNNPFPEYWTYFSARQPEYRVSLRGVDYAWLYPGPQLRVVREADFGQGVVLRGYRLERRAAQPGQNARLTLVWAGAASSRANESVTVRLGDAAGRRWAEASGPLLDPAGPSAVEGHYSFNLPADMPRGDYELEVTVGQAGNLSHPIGVIPVRQLDRPAMPLSLSANFGDWLVLAGAEVSPPQPPSTPGESKGEVRLKLLWQARQPIPASYTTFVHLVDAGGKMWGQVDRIPRPPGGDELPTNRWEPDEWIVDTFSLALNPGIPAGNYTLLAGVYDSQTIERLPVLGGAAGQTVVELGAITLP